MPGPLDTALIIQQLPQVQKLTNAEQTKPEAFQRLLGTAVLKEQTPDKDKVQQVTRKKRSDAVYREEEKEPEHREQFSGEREHEPSEEKKDTNEPAGKPSPWSGNFINLRI